MTFEHPPITPTVEQPALDAEWYERFEKVGAFQAYNYLTGQKEYYLDDAGILETGPNEKEKRLFLKGEKENPDIVYPKLEKLDIDKTEAKLLELKSAIVEKEADAIVRQAYLWKVNEKLAEIRMLRAARDGDDRRFTRYSKFIFGEPDPVIFDYTLFELSKKLRPALVSDNPMIRTLAERLQAELLAGKDLQHTEGMITAPSIPTAIFSEHPANPYRFPREIAARPKNTQGEVPLPLAKIIRAFEQALQEYRLDGWRVVISETHSGISVNQEAKTVTIPEKQSKMTTTALRGLIAHEIGVHAQRRERGERSQLKLLGLGLDRSLDDEGVAAYEEQKIVGGKDFAGFDGYLSIALALGADGKPRNFRQVFELLRDYHIITGKTPGKAADYSWGRTLRTFRGTSGKTPGACFTKDLIYRQGNIGVWHLVQENSGEQRRFHLGKYDPNNPRHLMILDQLGITDDNLQALNA